MTSRTRNWRAPAVNHRGDADRMAVEQVQGEPVSAAVIPELQRKDRRIAPSKSLRGEEVWNRGAGMAIPFRLPRSAPPWTFVDPILEAHAQHPMSLYQRSATQRVAASQGRVVPTPASRARTRGPAKSRNARSLSGTRRPPP